MNFLRQVRLAGVHRNLEQGGGPGVVAEVAMSWGFNHLGRFSADYRRSFGESPSDTLRRIK